jgi:hypothetical protein
MQSENNLHLSASTLEKMACLLSKEDRKKIFEELYESTRKRKIENIWLDTRIRKTDIYRYLPKTKSKRGGLIPSPRTTAKILMALQNKRKFDLIAKVLEAPGNDMHSSWTEYFEWLKRMRKSNIINNPLSDSELAKIERSLPGLRE